LDDKVNALLRLGNQLLNSGSYSDAIGYYDKMLAINGSNSHALNNKGFSLYSLGNYSGALYYYDKR
jgi:tetratricopeptide (TPR) repeat protein